MNILDRMIASVAPERALKRAQARRALDVVAHYQAATGGRRSKVWRPSPADADGAAARRQRLAYITRDMIRNTPFAVRAQQVIANNVVGDGVIPKVEGTAAVARLGLELVERHLDTTAIDADGRQNLYGLQRLIMNTVVESGEALVRRRRRPLTDPLPLPFQIQVIEPDYIDDAHDGPLASGNVVREGIEYDLIGRRVAYYLFDEHPGGLSYRGWGLRAQSRRVPASEVLHIYRQDRPGQRRGIPWLAAVAVNMQDLADHQDAELMRQKIAACFAAFRRPPDGVSDDSTQDTIGGTMRPGAIYNMQPGEDISFGVPPKTDGFEGFSRVVLRSIASGLGITYEALTNDLSNVNFSSARMGRMEMDRNVSSWQWTMMVPQFCVPFGEWFREAWVASGDTRATGITLRWVPPHRMLVDPAREIPALREKVRAGFASRQGVVRELGHDPERLMSEIKQDHEQAKGAGVQFSSDVRAPERAQNG